MTSERRPEIPTGFVWRQLSGTKAECQYLRAGFILI